MAGDLAAVVDDHDLAALGGKLDLLADQRVRDGVAGRSEAHAGEAVDLAQLALAQRRPERGQRSQRLPLAGKALLRHRTCLRVRPAVDLLAPDPGRPIGVRQGRKRPRRHEQVALRVADQVLDDTLRLRVVGLAEVGPEAVAQGEADVVWVRHDDVGDGGGTQAGHAVGEDGRRHPACLLEALGDQRQHRLAVAILSEADEAPA
jgi:hypothetical protein